MTNYAVIKAGAVVNVIEWDGESEFSPGDDLSLEDVSAVAIIPTIGWSFSDGVFTPPNIPLPLLADMKTAAIASLTASCAAAIVGGYQSSALGAAYAYPSGITDQINLMGSVTASLLPGLEADWTTPFWCADANGDWAFRDHTAAQIQQAGSDGKAHVVNCQATLLTLSGQVMAANTKAKVAAISWPVN